VGNSLVVFPKEEICLKKKLGLLSFRYSLALKSLGGGDELKRAGKLEWTLDCVTGTCATEGAWRPASTLVC